nr:DUF645 family protein [Vibrio cholerae]
MLTSQLLAFDVCLSDAFT